MPAKSGILRSMFGILQVNGGEASGPSLTALLSVRQNAPTVRVSEFTGWLDSGCPVISVLSPV